MTKQDNIRISQIKPKYRRDPIFTTICLSFIILQSFYFFGEIIIFLVKKDFSYLPMLEDYIDLFCVLFAYLCYNVFSQIHRNRLKSKGTLVNAKFLYATERKESYLYFDIEFNTGVIVVSVGDKNYEIRDLAIDRNFIQLLLLEPEYCEKLIIPVYINTDFPSNVVGAFEKMYFAGNPQNILNAPSLDMSPVLIDVKDVNLYAFSFSTIRKVILLSLVMMEIFVLLVLRWSTNPNSFIFSFFTINTIDTVFVNLVLIIILIFLILFFEPAQYLAQKKEHKEIVKRGTDYIGEVYKINKSKSRKGFDLTVLVNNRPIVVSDLNRESNLFQQLNSVDNRKYLFHNINSNELSKFYIKLYVYEHKGYIPESSEEEEGE